MFGYTRLVSFGHAAAYGFGAYACGWHAAAHRPCRCCSRCSPPRLLTGVMAIGVGWMCTLATGVSFSMLTLAFAQLLYAIAFKWTSVTGGSRRPGRHSAQARPVRLRGACRARPASTIWRLPAWSAASCAAAPWCARRSARCCAASARTKPRRRRWATTPASTRSPWSRSPTALGGLAGALYAPFAGLRQYRAAVLAAVGPGADHGHRRRRRDADRPGPGRRLLHADGAPAQSSWTEAWALYFGLIFIAFVLFAPEGIWGLATRRPRAAQRPEALTWPLLELDGVTRRYGALVALDHVAMQVEEGEVRAVIGPNGAGKTTLFNLITGMVKPTAGAVRFAGQPIAGLPSHEICRRGISRTFQFTALFPEMSARENASWRPRPGIRGAGSRSAAQGLQGARALGDAALEQLGLSAHRRPARRLAVARRSTAAGGRHGNGAAARVLLLDEPTQGLSVEETAQAVETLARFLRQRGSRFCWSSTIWRWCFVSPTGSRCCIVAR